MPGPRPILPPGVFHIFSPGGVGMSKPIGFACSRKRADRFLFLIIACSLTGAVQGRADTAVEDFEAAGAPAPWAFTRGEEFPGAQGSLGVTGGEGGSGHAARLEGDFSGGGAYVAAVLALPQAVNAPLLGFRARTSAGTRIVLRLVDNTGQTLQYHLTRPLEAMAQDAWYRQVVDLYAVGSSFGGAADKVPHPPFKSVGFLVEPLRFREAASQFNPHRADFDDVVFLSSREETLDAFATPAPFAGAPGLEGLGVNIHFTRYDAALDALAGSGMSWLRMDLGWEGIEKSKGAYGWSAYDALAESAAKRGLKLHLILDYGNALYGAGPPATAEAVAAFKAFASAAAAHFKGKAERFEVWNEPNIAQFWNPVDAKAYAAACAAAIAGVHQGNPDALVSTGGVSEIDFPFVRQALAAGAGVGADAIGVHPYRGERPETLADQVLLLRAIVKEAYPGAGSVPPLWDTEWGYTSAQFGAGRTAEARALHGRYTVRRILASWAAGFPFVINYDLLDDGPDALEREHNFGLLASDLSDKPAMTAVRTLAARARGFAAKGFLPTRQSDVHAFKLENGDQALIILWRERAGEFGVAAERDTVPVSFGARPAAGWDHLGKPIAIPAATGGRTTLSAGYDPAYLVFAKGGLPIRGDVKGKAGPHYGKRSGTWLVMGPRGMLRDGSGRRR